MVTENLNQVRENIKAACEAAGRDPKESEPVGYDTDSFGSGTDL